MYLQRMNEVSRVRFCICYANDEVLIVNAQCVMLANATSRGCNVENVLSPVL